MQYVRLMLGFALLLIATPGCASGGYASGGYGYGYSSGVRVGVAAPAPYYVYAPPPHQVVVVERPYGHYEGWHEGAYYRNGYVEHRSVVVTRAAPHYEHHGAPPHVYAKKRRHLAASTARTLRLLRLLRSSFGPRLWVFFCSLKLSSFAFLIGDSVSDF